MLFNSASSAILGKGIRLGAFGLRTELGHWVEIAEKVFAGQYAKKVGDEVDLKREWATTESSEFQLLHPCLAPVDTIFVEGIDVFLECSEGNVRWPLCKNRKRMSAKLCLLGIEIGC